MEQLYMICTWRPCLTDKDIQTLQKTITDKINIYNEAGYRLFEFECANGIEIHIEVNYCGFSYRRIRLQNVYVMYKVDDDYKSIEEYQNVLNGLLIDSIYELNSKEEEEYELENQYT